MGFIYDIPDDAVIAGVPLHGEVSGDVHCEARRESFVLLADGESIEMYYDQVRIIKFYILMLEKDRHAEIEAAFAKRERRRLEEIPHGASGDGELRPL